LRVNPQGTPVSIEGYYDEAMSVPGVLTVVQNTRTPMR
jgi:Asp/Glu/hydantoin racemase